MGHSAKPVVRAEMRQLAAAAPSATVWPCRPASAFGSTPTLSRLALPFAMSEQRRTECALRLASRLLTSARPHCVASPRIFDRLPRSVLGGSRCFLVLRRTSHAATVGRMHSSPMRATRPNVAFVAGPRTSEGLAGAWPGSLPMWATRPNPSFEPKCASWPQLHRALRSGSAGQQAHSAQLQR